MGHFAYGTYAHTGVALLTHSLDYIQKIGVDRIQAHSQTLVRRLRAEVPRLGFSLITPPEARTPFATFVLADAPGKLKRRLDAAKVKITLSRNRFRVTPSVFNDQHDVDRLLASLS
jgi:selenocysteine lyase/cysteine desulfurase